MTAIAPITFLQLVNKLALESMISTSAATVTDTANQTGMAARFVEWVAAAHRDVQDRHDNWRWLRSTWSVNTVAATDTYAYGACTDTRLTGAIDRFSHWIYLDDDGSHNTKKYLTSGGVAGESWLIYLPWSAFRLIYKRGPQQLNQGPPIHFTVDPQNKVVIGPIPDGIYTISGEYQMGAKDFASKNDTPEWPARFHDLVVWFALEKYGRSSAAGEAIAKAEIMSSRLMRRLERDQLPDITLGGPLC